MQGKVPNQTIQISIRKTTSNLYNSSHGAPKGRQWDCESQPKGTVLAPRGPYTLKNTVLFCTETAVIGQGTPSSRCAKRPGEFLYGGAPIV